MKTIDDITNGALASIDANILRKLLADSVRNCEECENLQLGALTKGDRCESCQQILKLMPSVKKELKETK